MSDDLTLDDALAEAYHRALDARDARFDGIFFVGITTTHIYCRPTCPARVSHPERRRFFRSAAAAERAGFRPCLRCRPELAPGHAAVDAVSRLARLAACRIAGGALNERSVADLARELDVSERRLRRVLEREIGVTPLELALTHRLLLAKRLLADTRLSVTRVAYASGFGSLRRFNAAFRERYRMSPSDLRRPSVRREHERADDMVRLTLAYRPPFDWAGLLELLRRDAVRGVDVVIADRYVRTVRLDGHTGVISVRDVSASATRHQVEVELSPGLLPVLMPLLARVRQTFDLDAEPAVIDALLAREGLATLVAERPGLRVPGSSDGFDAALRALLRRSAGSQSAYEALGWRIAMALGDAIETGDARLCRLTPEPRRVADAGPRLLVSLGMGERHAGMLVRVARAVATNDLRLEPGVDPEHTARALAALGVDDGDVARILAQAVHWPDAFPLVDEGASRPAIAELQSVAERWRPWRAYAAAHLRLREMEPAARSAASGPAASHARRRHARGRVRAAT